MDGSADGFVTCCRVLLAAGVVLPALCKAPRVAAASGSEAVWLCQMCQGAGGLALALLVHFGAHSVAGAFVLAARRARTASE